MAEPTRFHKRQLAARRLLLDSKGKLNRNAVPLAVMLRSLCAAAPTQALTQYDAQGRIDPIATAAAAQRREIWDAFVKLLNLDQYEAVNLQEEE